MMIYIAAYGIVWEKGSSETSKYLYISYSYTFWISSVFLLWNRAIFAVESYAKFSLAENSSFYKTVGCFIVRLCIWKTTAGENWHFMEKYRAHQVFYVQKWASRKDSREPVSNKVCIYRNYCVPGNWGVPMFKLPLRNESETWWLMWKGSPWHAGIVLLCFIQQNSP